MNKAEINQLVNMANNGKSPRDNCIETGICMYKFESNDANVRSNWIHAGKCLECAVTQCEYNRR